MCGAGCLPRTFNSVLRGKATRTTLCQLVFNPFSQNGKSDRP
jgi:hypothetical protein